MGFGERDGGALEGDDGRLLDLPVTVCSFLAGETGTDCYLPCSVTRSAPLHQDFFLFCVLLLILFILPLPF